MSKRIEECILGGRGPGRRSFIQKLALAGTVLGAASTNVGHSQTQPAITDADILNFALNLEYLEAEFYTYATTGQGIAQAGLGVVGTGATGATTGGRQVTFTDNVVQAIAKEIALDEQAHVALIRSALSSRGIQPIAKPAIDLNALGIGFASQAEFLTLARAFEDVGVTAYGGAAPLIQDKTILGVAARILATEAEHVGSIRLQVAQKGLPTMPLDGVDILPPPTGSHYFSADAMGLTAIRTPGQVLAIVYAKANASSGGFFPTGVNGTITSSSTPASDGGATGSVGGATITASPNPIVSTGPGGGVTTINWSAPSAGIIEVRVGSVNGGLLTRFGNSGSMQTGPWVTDGMTFYLQDVTDGKALTSANTVATVVVHVQRTLPG